MRVTVFLALALAAVLPAQTLHVVRPVISDSEDGPPLAPGQSFQPGDPVFFSFQVENYKVNTLGKVQLTGHVEAFDSRGIRIAPPDEEVIATSLSEEDKDWKPKLRSQLILPSIAPPGPWTVKYDVTDEQTHQKATGETQFSVRGPAADTSPELVFRNFGFYRTQEDPAPLKTPAYQPGDQLWVKFELTGYKYGEQNAIDVSYDVAVTAPGDRKLFTQADAAVERSQAYYPQPWVPAEFSLSLQSTMTPGTYLLEITAHDGVGKQTASYKGDFRIER